jgi:hypothetical protein
VCSSYAFLRLERSLLRWRRTAIETITADMLQTVWNELDYRVNFVESQRVCTYRATVRCVTKTWSAVLLNKKKYIHYLKCIVCDKLLKPRQPFLINVYTVTYTRCRINSPYDGHMAARNMQRIEINVHEEELCVKLVIYKDYTEMHGQQNIKVC